MRKIIATTFVSLDGVMQAPGQPDEDPTGGFELGGWIVPFMEETAAKILNGIYKRPYDLLLGRRTYDIFAGYWPHVEKDPDRPGYDEGNAKMGQAFDEVTKYVATSSPETLGWQHSQWLGQNIVKTLKELKAETDGGPLLIPGSGKLVQSLMEHRLVDELRLFVFPLVLGKGKRLFADDGKPTEFKVSHTATTPNGVLVATYETAGDVRTGTFDELPEKTRPSRSKPSHA
jgi:dihydrofolate reductase